MSTYIDITMLLHSPIAQFPGAKSRSEAPQVELGIDTISTGNIAYRAERAHAYSS